MGDPPQFDRRRFLAGIGRAAGGAIFFSLPLLMTMEMWQLGFSMGRWPLVLFMVLMFPMLVGLDRLSGFRDASRWSDEVADGMLAYGVGVVTSASVLALLGIITPGMPAREVVGKIALQSVPASFGAVLAASQLYGGGGGSAGSDGNGTGQQELPVWGYRWDLFLMTAGALFFAFNLAPTEEMILIAFRISPGYALLLMAVTIAAMHGFVYAVDFAGSARPPKGTPAWSLLARFTVPGYAIALLVSAYVLWSFGRYEDHAPAMMLRMAVVLGFPAGLGAAAARLVI